MAFLLSLLQRKHERTVFSTLVGSLVPLSTKKCDPYICSTTRTGVDLKSVGGSLHHLGLPDSKQPKRWKRSVAVPLQSRYSLTASTWEDDSGQGSVVLETQSPARRRRRHSSRSKLKLVRGKRSDDDSHLVHTDASLENKQVLVSPKPITPATGSESKDWAPSSISCMSRDVPAVLLEKSRSSKRVKQSRVELARDSKNGNLAISKHDPKHGKFDLNFTPGKRFAASMTLKESFWKRRARQRVRSRYKRTRRSHEESERSRHSTHMKIKTELEYRWKENSFSVLNAIEAFHGALSLRTRSNPMRFTPRIQVPVGRRRKDPPWMSWTREPSSGLGEIQLGRKGFEVSADWPNPRVSLKQKSSDGSSARVSLNSKGVFSVDKTIVSKPMHGGSIITFNAYMANKKGGSGITATVTGPFGVFSASANTSRAFNITADMNLDNGDRAYALALKVETSKTISARLGLFF